MSGIPVSQPEPCLGVLHCSRLLRATYSSRADPIEALPY